MTETHPNPLLNQVRHLIGSVSAAVMTDGQLLERFLANRDETAVEALVRRYGPLILGVCRRVLHNAHSAEDAFQATFLVLTRKAPSLDRGKPLGSWLCTVAYRLALRARANELRRQQCEERAARSRPSSHAPDPSAGDLVVALEEELHRMPERHRAPLVLCYLEGKTNEQAAEILGCPRGSMAARLAQARERLRKGLAQRGFVAPSAAIAAVLSKAAVQAAVPLPLLDKTVRAALWFAREDACAAGFVSTHAVALAKGAFRSMFLNKLKIAGALLLAVAMLGTGATMLLKAAPQDRSPEQSVEQAPARTELAGVRGAPAEGNANAALEYGRAFVPLRRLNQEKLIAECLTMPLDARAREFVTRGAYALRLMRRGAALTPCDWGLHWEEFEGVGIDLPHQKQAQVLSSLACLRARLGFEEGRNTEAMEDIVAALTLARHVSLDGTLLGVLCGYTIEHRMSETLVPYLPRLNAELIRSLKTRLDALPPGGSMARATARSEEEFLKWIVGEVREAKDKEGLLDFLVQVCIWDEPKGSEEQRARGRAVLEECGGTAQGVLKYAEETRPLLAPMAKTLDLPLDQFVKECEREEMKRPGNPIFKLMAHFAIGQRTRLARADVRRALLSAAVAVQLDGRDALKNHPDPAVGGPFEYVALEGGFELRSKWKLDEKLLLKWKIILDEPQVTAVSLIVGRRGR